MNHHRKEESGVTYLTKAEHAANVLREAIANGEIRPGERLRSEAWARKLSLSTTPVREAFRLLEAEGIIEIHPHRGASVSQVTRREFVEVYRMRAALESLAVEMFFERISDEERAQLVERLSQLQAVFRREAERSHLRGAREANRDFHVTLYSAVGSTRLLTSIMSLWAVFPFDTLMLVPGRLLIAAGEHEKILEAIKAGDPRTASAAMKHHIEGAAQLLLDSPVALARVLLQE